jgi:hypothetical protein
MHKHGFIHYNYYVYYKLNNIINYYKPIMYKYNELV